MTTRLKGVLLTAALVASSGRGGAAQNRVPAGQPAPPAPTSFDLIDRALNAKEIDVETAHKYRVFAGFGDSRLPSKYHGDDGGFVEPHPSVAEAGRLMRTFSAQTQAELRPFFQRPGHPGSWVTLSTVRGQSGPTGPVQPPPPDERGGPGPGQAEPITDRSSSVPATQAVTWRTVSAAGGYAKVWAQDRYPGDYAKAQVLASELSTLIWDKLTNLMHQVPETDGGFDDNGGDYALDFYLIHAPNTYEGLTASADPADPCLSSQYILIDSGRNPIGSATQPGILQIAAHELMHAIQFAYQVKTRCPAPWIREASATWAENFVYPRANSEHPYAKSYLTFPTNSIDGYATPTFSYGAYLFPYFLEMTSGGAGFMPRMWDNFRRMDDLEGVNAVLTGGFDKAWPKFLVKIWNQPPVDAPDGFKQWDQLPDAVFPWHGLDRVATPNGMVTRKMDFLVANPPTTPVGGITYLSGFFRHFVFDQNVRSVVFKNTIAEAGFPHASVWGIEKVGGRWREPVDWSKEFHKSWCRDQTSQNVEELVLIFGNSDWHGRQPLQPAEEPTVKAYPTGCVAWVGTVTASFSMTTPELGNLVETDTSTVRFEVDSSFHLRGRTPEYWKSTGGAIHWSVSATGGKCTVSEQGTVPVGLGGDQNPMAILNLWDDGSGKLQYMVAIGPWQEQHTPRFNYTCRDQAPLPTTLLAGTQWWPAPPFVATDPAILTGTYRTGFGAGTMEWTWTLRRAP